MIRTSKRQTRKFCWTRPSLFEDKQSVNPHRNSSREKNFPINPMKTLLIATLCSVTLVVEFFRPIAAAAGHSAGQSSGGRHRTRRDHDDPGGCRGCRQSRA